MKDMYYLREAPKSWGSRNLKEILVISTLRNTITKPKISKEGVGELEYPNGHAQHPEERPSQLIQTFYVIPTSSGSWFPCPQQTSSFPLRFSQHQLSTFPSGPPSHFHPAFAIMKYQLSLLLNYSVHSLMYYSCLAKQSINKIIRVQFPLFVIFLFLLILLIFLILSFVVLYKSDTEINIANVSFRFIRKSCGRHFKGLKPRERS